MKSNLLFLIILFFQNFNSQVPNIDWQKTYGGNGTEYGQSISKTSDGGYILAGSSNSTNIPSVTTHGGRDYYLIKINSLGVIVWQKFYGGSNDEFLYDVKETPDQGFILAGYTNSNDGDVTGSHGSADYWIVKLDQNGDIVWQKTFGGSSVDIANSVALTDDGGYIVSGYTYSNNGDVTNNYGSNDYWVLKLDGLGNKLWQKSYGGNGDDNPYSIVKSSDGNYVIAGKSTSTNGLVTGNHGNSDYWILKINQTGDLIWQKSYGGSNLDGANSITEVPEGGYIIAGLSTSSNGDVTENKGLGDIWITKITESGALEWQKSLGGTKTDNARSIQNTVDGGYIIAGYTNSNDGDVTGYHGNSDYTDFWIIKLSKIGTIEWQKAYGGTKDDAAQSVVQNLDGSYVIFGYSASIDGDIANNLGNYDYWVVKLKPENLDVVNSIYSSFSIYPNPTKEIIYFPSTVRSLEIYSTDGKFLIKKENISSVNIKTLPSGNYILRIVDSEGKFFTRKVIKN